MYSPAGFSGMTRRGFPHSDICASTPACGSTQLIAANHVLHRLLTPRHPPSALNSLTTSLLDLRRGPAGSRPRFAFRDFLDLLRHDPPARACLGLSESRTRYLLIACLLDSRFVNYSVVNDRRWRIRGSNPRPQACKARALPAELIPQNWEDADRGRSFKTDSRR